MDYLVPMELVFNVLQWPIEKKRQVIWDALQVLSGRIEWQRTLIGLEKVLEVAT